MDLDAYPTTHELRQLTPRAWWMNPVYTTDRPSIGVVVGEQGALVVEAGNSAPWTKADSSGRRTEARRTKSSAKVSVDRTDPALLT